MLENTVIMSLKDYDELREVINTQRKYITRLTENRIKELREIFQLSPSYNSIGIYIDATDIIREIYKEELTIKDVEYHLYANNITADVYGIYRKTKTEIQEEIEGMEGVEEIEDWRIS